MYNIIVPCHSLKRAPLYTSKLFLRRQLKNIGDVNILGRLHVFLEQSGVINFGNGLFSFSSIIISSYISLPYATSSIYHQMSTTYNHLSTTPTTSLYHPHHITLPPPPHHSTTPTTSIYHPHHITLPPPPHHSTTPTTSL